MWFPKAHPTFSKPFPSRGVYNTWSSDADGQPLDASKNRYSVMFARGQLPNAKYFWSITMYNLPGRLLVDNPIKRYQRVDEVAIA